MADLLELAGCGHNQQDPWWQWEPWPCGNIIEEKMPSKVDVALWCLNYGGGWD